MKPKMEITKTSKDTADDGPEVAVIRFFSFFPAGIAWESDELKPYLASCEINELINTCDSNSL